MNMFSILEELSKRNLGFLPTSSEIVRKKKNHRKNQWFYICCFALIVLLPNSGEKELTIN